MTNVRARRMLVLGIGLLSVVIGITARSLVARVRFGLEFRGGYEIYYVVSPAAGKTQISADDLLATASILRQRADSIGMAEPEIHIEGENHIRVKLAGLTSAEELRSLLGRAQGLPTTLTEKYSQTVGSVLGNTALRETMIAGAIGIGCIFLLLLAVYRGLSVLAAFSTLVYLWVLTLIFTACHATLSLSAVVAFVLGIGMAADASIICFERIREEFASGASAEEAVHLGFSGSWPTIRDANLVTALAMIALFVAGIGPIQGFSITMLASIGIGITTNYFLVRVLCLWLVQANLLPSSMLIGIKFSARGRRLWTVDFVGFGKPALIIAALTIMAGALYYRAHGFNLDIDFTAGTALDIDLDRGVDQDTATQIMTEADTVPATVAIGGINNTHIAARFDEVLPPAGLKRILAAFQAHYRTVEYEENTADPGVARDFARRALAAIGAAFVSILLYIGWRFSWAVALATVVPIVLDVLLVSALFALCKWEIDVTYIAAMLTIMGYSLNDKIVIFGRIRENLSGMIGTTSASLRRLVNVSIHQTLGRSVYTVLTVVLASASLYLFACEPLQMFSLAILLGLVSGALSSIFMASVLWLSLRTWQTTTNAETESDPYLLTPSFLVPLGLVVALGVSGWVMIPPPTALSPARVVVGDTRDSEAVGSPSPATAITHVDVAFADDVKKRPLGDLSSFVHIASDCLALVQQGDLKGAKARIKDLETAWDDAEEQMQPLSPSDWTAVDKAIDRALTQLRSGNPDATSCETALKTLIAKMNSLS